MADSTRGFRFQDMNPDAHSEPEPSTRTGSDSPSLSRSGAVGRWLILRRPLRDDGEDRPSGNATVDYRIVWCEWLADDEGGLPFFLGSTLQ